MTTLRLNFSNPVQMVIDDMRAKPASYALWAGLVAVTGIAMANTFGLQTEEQRIAKVFTNMAVACDAMKQKGLEGAYVSNTLPNGARISYFCH